MERLETKGFVLMSDKEKLSKSLVLYVYNPGSNYTCQQCCYMAGGKCSQYIKSDDNVSKTGSCNLWDFDENGTKKIFGPKSRTKEATGYMDSKVGFGCRRCEYFIADNKLCKKVDESESPNVGLISPGACCSGFEADPIRAKLTDSQLNSMRNYKV